MSFFSSNLKKLRGNRSQQEIADDLHVTRQAYTSWENGTRTPKISQIEKIADYFGVGIDIVAKDYEQINSLDEDEIEKLIKQINNLKTVDNEGKQALLSVLNIFRGKDDNKKNSN